MKYTREQLEAMPDRELDAVVASVVMGWKWHLCHELNQRGEMVYHFRKDEPPDFWKRPTEVEAPTLPEVDGVRHYVRLGVPFYSTDIAAAWEVVGKMRSADYRPMLDDCGNRWWVNFVGPVTDGQPLHDWRRNVEHQSLPRAICIAAVLAVQEANK